MAAFGTRQAQPPHKLAGSTIGKANRHRQQPHGLGSGSAYAGYRVLWWQMVKRLRLYLHTKRILVEPCFMQDMRA